MTEVLYGTLDKVLARPAHRIYDDVREQFFADHAHLVILAPGPRVMAHAERHAEQSGWAVRWSRASGYDMRAELLDQAGTVLATMAGIDSRDVTTDYARVVEGYLASQAFYGATAWVG